MALHKADECGILHGRASHQPNDDHGCLLENGHDGPHEFADRYGQHWLWETDLSCECEWCMKGEGDYCTIYWRKPDDGAEREYVSWFPIAPKEASRGESWLRMASVLVERLGDAEAAYWKAYPHASAEVTIRRSEATTALMQHLQTPGTPGGGR